MSAHKNLRGRDLHAPSNELIENGTGGTITKAKVVRLNGMGTVYPKVALADPNTFENFGIMQADTLSGKVGYVCAFGFMFEQDTSAWSVGDAIYSDASGNLTTDVLGGIIAHVIKVDPEFGVLYVTAEAGNDVNSTSWRLLGNNGIDELVNFIGTINAADLRVRTNNQLRAIIDKNGRVGIGPDLLQPLNHLHQKSQTGYEGSGLRTETWAVTTNSATPQVAISIPVDQNSNVKVEFIAHGRISDGSGRASFKRVATFYREASNVQIQRFWQTPETEKSDMSFNVSYTMGVNEVTLLVKSSVGMETYWTGHVKIEATGTDI